MTNEQKQRIDSMNYEQMLRLWRNSKIGEPLFRGETGSYFIDQMEAKKTALPDGEAVEISKRIGWEK